MTENDALWEPDLENMTYRNIYNNTVVEFKKKGQVIIGRIRDIPHELFEVWAKKVNGHVLMHNMIMEAETVFIEAYYPKK